MSEQAGSRPGVIDVTEESFERDVLERSVELPVVVDFWAPWCGPCRALGPVLEKLALGEFRGRLVVAKLNTDESPELSQTFGIRGIPAVKAFRNRRVTAEFVGALPEEQVREFFKGLEPSEADERFQEALAAESAGNAERGLALLREALAADPRHPGALLALGERLERAGEREAARDCYERIGATSEQAQEASRGLARLHLSSEAAACGEESRLRERSERDPGDLEARYGLALHSATRGATREALEMLLAIVAQDRRFRDDGARKAMLRIFEIVGVRSELADEYRARLARVLF